MVEWISLRLTSGMPSSWPMAWAASRIARFWTISRVLCSSTRLIRWAGSPRGTVTEVEKPLTCSPAIPITARPGIASAMSSACSRAVLQLSITAWMSATAPETMSE